MFQDNGSFKNYSSQFIHQLVASVSKSLWLPVVDQPPVINPVHPGGFWEELNKETENWERYDVNTSRNSERSQAKEMYNQTLHSRPQYLNLLDQEHEWTTDGRHIITRRHMRETPNRRSRRFVRYCCWRVWPTLIVGSSDRPYLYNVWHPETLWHSRNSGPVTETKNNIYYKLRHQELMYS